MRGNCRLRRHHDKLPPPPWGPSCETRFHQVMLSLRVLSAIDLDCSLPLGYGKGWHKTKARGISAHGSDQKEDQRLDSGIRWYITSAGICRFLIIPFYATLPAKPMKLFIIIIIPLLQHNSLREFERWQHSDKVGNNNNVHFSCWHRQTHTQPNVSLDYWKNPAYLEKVPYDDRKN